MLNQFLVVRRLTADNSRVLTLHFFHSAVLDRTCEV